MKNSEFKLSAFWMHMQTLLESVSAEWVPISAAMRTALISQAARVGMKQDADVILGLPMTSIAHTAKPITFCNVPTETISRILDTVKRLIKEGAVLLDASQLSRGQKVWVIAERKVVEGSYIGSGGYGPSKYQVDMKTSRGRASGYYKLESISLTERAAKNVLADELRKFVTTRKGELLLAQRHLRDAEAELRSLEESL